MFWRRFALVLSLAALSCVLSPGAAAQSNKNCIDTTTWWFPLVIPTGWSYYGPYPGTLTYVIWAPKATCAPPASPTETKPKCPAAGSPICLATGNTYLEQSDVRVPGLSGGLNLMRTWNSQWPSTQSGSLVGLFGPNWRSTYEEKVFIGGDYYIKYSRGDGSFWSFGAASSTPGSWSLAAPQDVAATLTTPSIATPYWTITFQNGEKRTFDGTSGMLTAIIDRNGNTTTVAYDGTNRLATITDPASRHLYFGYGSPSSHLVTSVTSDVGVSVSYSYDAQNRLSVVTQQDSSTLTFAYNAQSLITSVTDINGKILESHTYGSSGRGLTSSRANGVESVTLTYSNP